MLPFLSPNATSQNCSFERGIEKQVNFGQLYQQKIYFNWCTALGKNLSILPSVTLIKEYHLPYDQCTDNSLQSPFHKSFGSQIFCDFMQLRSVKIRILTSRKHAYKQPKQKVSWILYFSAINLGLILFQRTFWWAYLLGAYLVTFQWDFLRTLS